MVDKQKNKFSEQYHLIPWKFSRIKVEDLNFSIRTINRLDIVGIKKASSEMFEVSIATSELF